MCVFKMKSAFIYFVTLILFNSVLYGYCFQQTGNTGVTEIFTNATNLLYKCTHPEHFQMRLNFPGQDKVTLDLRRHDKASNRYPPTFLLSRLPRLDVGAESPKKDFVRYASTSPDSHIFVECHQTQHEQKSKFLSISGVVLHNGTEYVIQSLKPAETSSLGLILVHWHRIVDAPLTHDYVLSENSNLLSHQLLSDQDHVISPRDRRDVGGSRDVHTFGVDILAVVDFSVYLKWFSSVDGGTIAQRSVRVKNEIQKYYHHVISGVDLRYKSIGFADFQIRVNLSGIIIIDNRTFANGPSMNQTNEMDADTALKIFRSWINDTSGLPGHNHAILFTGYDLYTTKGNNEKIAHTSGLAFIGTLCEPGDSVSIVEEQGGFQSIGTAAHEIGHSLGALHDGENNTCHSEDRYIMAASGFGPVPENKKYNPWIFSPCTVEYFKKYITSLLVSGSNCLTTAKSDIIIDEKEVKTKQLVQPGQYYSPDNQCRQIWGPTSYLCRGAEFGDASTICTAMYCRDPSTESDCVLHTAARGTSCGNKRWCMNGHCVYSPRAPSTQEPCVLGDQPGPAFNSMTCEELISKSPSYCYQEKVRARCCNTCWSKHTYRKGCEYGDRIQGCRLWHCSHFFESRDIQKECCGTCGIGEVVTKSNSQQVFPPEGQLSTSSPVKWNPDTCMDTGLFSDLTCSEYIYSRGSFVCYNNATAQQCCDSCRKVRRQTEGCEYGDRIPSLCDSIKNKTELTCLSYGEFCCNSCVSPKDKNSVASISSHFFTSSIVFYLFNVFIALVFEYCR